MSRFWKLFIFAISILAVPSAFAILYTVKKGDVLSKIAQSHIEGPVYGKSGSLNRILKQNASIKDPNVLYAGQTIELEDLARFPAKETPTPPPETNGDTTAEVKNSEAPTVDTSAATQTTEKELVLAAHASYGAAMMNFSQTGAFGSINGTSLSLNRSDVEVSGKLENFSGDLEFSRYSIAMGTDTANTSSKQDQSFDEFSLKGGYKNLVLGVRSKSSPIFKTGSGTTLDWASLNTLSALAGFHCEHEWAGPSLRPYRVSLDTEAELPFSGGSDSGIDISSIKGYAFRARGRAEKTLIQGNGYPYPLVTRTSLG